MTAVVVVEDLGVVKVDAPLLFFFFFFDFFFLFPLFFLSFFSAYRLSGGFFFAFKGFLFPYIPIFFPPFCFSNGTCCIQDFRYR